jgi:hypothetical protein
VTGWRLAYIIAQMTASDLAWWNFVVLVATVVVLTATLGAIIWYSLETRWLRQETALQTELQLRPLLTINHDGDVLSLVNIGKGMARDVSMQDTDLPGPGAVTVFIRWPPIDHLPAGESRRLSAHSYMSADGREAVLADDDSRRVAAHFSPNSSRETSLMVVIEYGNLVMRPRYRTTISHLKGIATIAEDLRIEG